MRRTTAAWWLVWTYLPLAMKGQINNQESKASQTQHKSGSSRENSWLPTASQLHFFARRNLDLEPFLTAAEGCPKVVILVQLYLL